MECLRVVTEPGSRKLVSHLQKRERRAKKSDGMIEKTRRTSQGIAVKSLAIWTQMRWKSSQTELGVP